MSNGPNTTGLPDPTDYNLGRGIVYFAYDLDANGKPQIYRDMGNCTDFTISTESETLEHFSSRTGLKTLDKEVTLSRTTTISFTLDELNDENLADLFSGDKATHTNVAVAGFSEYQMVADGDLVLGRWYDIVNSSGERAYDVLAVDLTVTTSEAAPVAMVLDTDYTLDIEFGRIFVLSTSTVAATAIGTGDGLNVTVTAETTASDVNEVRALTQSAVQGALKFIADNPADDGAKREYQLHSVNLKADGDFSLIGDDWTGMGFTASLEAAATVDADSPTMTIRTVDPADA